MFVILSLLCAIASASIQSVLQAGFDPEDLLHFNSPSCLADLPIVDSVFGGIQTPLTCLEEKMRALGDPEVLQRHLETGDPISVICELTQAETEKCTGLATDKVTPVKATPCKTYFRGDVSLLGHRLHGEAVWELCYPVQCVTELQGQIATLNKADALCQSLINSSSSSGVGIDSCTTSFTMVCEEELPEETTQIPGPESPGPGPEGPEGDSKGSNSVFIYVGAGVAAVVVIVGGVVGYLYLQTDFFRRKAGSLTVNEYVQGDSSLVGEQVEDSLTLSDSDSNDISSDLS